jgi:hypothetical protein
MLERYFVKPQTIDRIRALWIGPQIEQYVAWLADQGYGSRCVWRRVPLLAAFGEFARLNGARSLADLPGHVDAFVDKRASESRRARRRVGPTFAKDMRGPVEQLLELVVPGFEGTGRPHHHLPFADALPGFFGYLASERGLAPPRWPPTSTTSTASRPGSREPVSPDCTSCLRRCSAPLLPSVPRPGWRRRRSARAARCCGCSCVTHTVKGLSAASCGTGPGPAAAQAPCRIRHRTRRPPIPWRGWRPALR